MEMGRERGFGKKIRNVGFGVLFRIGVAKGLVDYLE